MEIQDRKDVFVAISQLAESKGAVICVSELRVTANRMSRGAIIIKQKSAILIDGIWYSPVPISEPNEADISNNQEQIERDNLFKKLPQLLSSNEMLILGKMLSAA